MTLIQDIVGEKFGRLTVTQIARRLGFKEPALRYMLFKGVSLIQSITTLTCKQGN